MNAPNRFIWTETPSRAAFPIAKPGLAIVGAGAFITAVFAMLQYSALAILGLAATIFTAFFFRDPDRPVPAGEDIVVSPADGKVIVVDGVEETEYYAGPCLKISIFMNVFNVHVNRVPHEGRVVDIQYHPGLFVAASLDKASAKNERNAIWIETKTGIQMTTVQIAGLVARRIISTLQIGDDVQRGQRIGMICLGSRLDIYLPDSFQATVSIGDKVKAGTSVLGRFQ